MSDSIRLPRLLDESGQEAGRLRPTAYSLALNRRSASTAAIQRRAHHALRVSVRKSCARMPSAARARRGG